MKRILLLLTVVLAGCAAAPEMAPVPAPAPAPTTSPARPAPAPVRPPIMDGGIVGTGNQLDCEPRTAKDGTPVPLPAECRR